MTRALLGIAVILGVAWLCSTARKEVRRRIVACALAAQVAIAVIVLKVPAGRATMSVIGSGVEALLGFAHVGSGLVFGDIISPSIQSSIVLFVLPAIIFFSALVSVLYHLGVMQLIVRVFGRLISLVLGVGRIEGLFAAANIFLGQTESPLVVRPYLRKLNRSQLFAIMTSGMAGVAGTVLAAYAQLGVRIDYLLAASIMSAPGSLLIAKIMMPDRNSHGRDDILSMPVPVKEASHSNIIMAASEGAQTGLKIAAGVGAMLLAFAALIALANALLGWGGGFFGIPSLTLQSILGHIFAPVLYLLDLTWSEAVLAGSLFGEKLILNEFVAFVDFAKIQPGLTTHAQAIIIFSLCGFANVGSIAIQMAVIGGISPRHRHMVAHLGMKALLAASLANLLNAAIAGILVQ